MEGRKRGREGERRFSRRQGRGQGGRDAASTTRRKSKPVPTLKHGSDNNKAHTTTTHNNAPKQTVRHVQRRRPRRRRPGARRRGRRVAVRSQGAQRDLLVFDSLCFVCWLWGFGFVSVLAFRLFASIRAAPDPPSTPNRRGPVSTKPHTRTARIQSKRRRPPREKKKKNATHNNQAPNGARFSVLAASGIKRLYHSTALLLPSGDLLVMGSEQSARPAGGGPRRCFCRRRLGARGEARWPATCPPSHWAPRRSCHLP